MRDLYPGYDVLAKRHTPSWNEQTRVVIERRLAIDPNAHRFFIQSEWDTLQAICARIIPQEMGGRDPVPIAAMIDQKIADRQHDGYRDARLREPAITHGALGSLRSIRKRWAAIRTLSRSRRGSSGRATARHAERRAQTRSLGRNAGGAFLPATFAA